LPPSIRAEPAAMTSVTSLHPQYIVDPQGQKTSVLLPIEEYETLLEDLNDLALVAERRDEPVIEHADVVARLKADGLL
jgi:hypothetical protein